MPRPTYPPPLPPPISTTCPPADTTAAPLLAASPLALYSVPPYNGPEPALAPYDPNAGSRGFGRGRSAKKRQKQEPVEDDDDALPAEDQNMPSKKVKKGPQAKKECKKPKTDGPSLSVRRLKATLSQPLKKSASRAKDIHMYNGISTDILQITMENLRLKCR
ncbi:hypothetical protein M409DRAFT_19135 [Zasmidium cellare ATCC 36951]|uniref:Uncharacterized protein n=1 Tax=Zasmidium cellare ATCC 36951 TaxID=1080233 RepID=A0A6A6CVJ7_ZASCE|nr:uncharacterized protein M409DRAFT_19135 [Zasmidium cellare ATCC 36951]KAF2171164.1 hypothetical protein M409DRAFT_19135 [Zasmidium cellare ATCC 36951]